MESADERTRFDESPPPYIGEKFNVGSEVAGAIAVAVAVAVSVAELKKDQCSDSLVSFV